MSTLTVNDINENAEKFLEARKLSNRRPKGLEKVATMNLGLAHCSIIIAGFQEGRMAKISSVVLPVYLDCPGLLKNREAIDAMFLQLL